MTRLPNKRELEEAIIAVLTQSPISMTTQDINTSVATFLQISSDLLEIEDSNCTGSEFSYRMRWARTDLKQKGKIKSIKRGMWELV